MTNTNQASEDERIVKDNDRIYQGLAHLHRQKHLKGGCFCTSEISGVYKVILDEVNALIRTEKLKLLAEVRERVVEQAKPDKRKATSWQQGIEVSAYEDAVRVYEYKMNKQLTKLEAEL